MSVEERDAYMNETHALFTHIDTSERRKLALAKQAAEQQLERIDEGPPASLCKFESHKQLLFLWKQWNKSTFSATCCSTKNGLNWT